MLEKTDRPRSMLRRLSVDVRTITPLDLTHDSPRTVVASPRCYAPWFYGRVACQRAEGNAAGPNTDLIWTTVQEHISGRGVT